MSDHDRVYSPQSLVPEQERLEVDHDMSVAGLYIDIVKDFIEKHRSLALLSQVREQ